MASPIVDGLLLVARPSLSSGSGGAHLSVVDYLGALDWRGHKQTKDWYAVMKSRPCFCPLLGEQMEVIDPPPTTTRSISDAPSDRHPELVSGSISPPALTVNGMDAETSSA
jgi:hypothetical protein